MLDDKMIITNTENGNYEKCDTEKPYIFVSYSRRDRDIVWRDVNILQQMGYNIWIDMGNVEAGKAWDSNAMDAIQSFNCKAFIFYISKNSLCSEPCLEELRKTRDEMTKKLHRREELKRIPIEVSPIDDLVKFSDDLYDSITSDPTKSKDEKEKIILTISTIMEEFFNNSNAMHRIKSNEITAGRNKEYYEEIEEEFPIECCDEEKRSLREEKRRRKKEEADRRAEEELNRIKLERIKKEATEWIITVNPPNSASPVKLPGTAAIPQGQQQVYVKPVQAQAKFIEPVKRKKNPVLTVIIVLFVIVVVGVLPPQVKKYLEKSRERGAQVVSQSEVSTVTDLPQNGETSDPATDAVPDTLDLREAEPYTSQCVDIDMKVSASFSYKNRVWDKALIFRAGNGYDNAFCEWNIGGNYNTLTLEFFPYYDNSFFERSKAELQVINVDTGEILHSETVTYDSDIINVSADITGVDNLRITVNKTDGMLAYCLLNNIVVSNETADESTDKESKSEKKNKKNKTE